MAKIIFCLLPLLQAYGICSGVDMYSNPIDSFQRELYSQIGIEVAFNTPFTEVLEQKTEAPPTIQSTFKLTEEIFQDFLMIGTSNLKKTTHPISPQ